MNTPIQRRFSAQRGAALVISLILLSIMTLLALALLRTTLLDERMSGGLYDRSLAFQAAEAALREAEALVAPGTAVFPASGCNAGLCMPIDRAANPTALDRWVDPAFAGWATAAALGDANSVQPQYIVEQMGPAPNWPGCDQEVPMHASCMTPRFRITARSAQAGRSSVILQSNFVAATP